MLLIDCGLMVIGIYCLYELVDKSNIANVIGVVGGCKSSCNSDKELIVGYSGKFVKKPIVVNMDRTPHLLCCGLSGQGKSVCIEQAVKGKRAILVNAFADDFKAIKARRILGQDNILKFLQSLLNEPYKREKPLYVVIDEMIVLCMDKKISKAILDLLAVGRHYNIFVIGIAQRGTKSDLSFKDLFNARMTFRQVEESSYRAILGYSVEERNLQKQEFILAADDLYYGKTYDVK